MESKATIMLFLISLLTSWLTPERLESLIFIVLARLVKTTASPIDDELVEIVRLYFALYKKEGIDTTVIHNGLKDHKEWLTTQAAARPGQGGVQQ